jgi:cell division protein FtsB
LITVKQNIIISLSLLAMFFLFLLIIFGDKGLADLNMLKKSRESLIAQNEALMQENLSLYRSIGRLNTDPVFIENVARQELGMIGKNEVIYSGAGNRVQK